MSRWASGNATGLYCAARGRLGVRSARAVVAVQVTVALVLLLGMAALAVDIGFILVSTGQMQAAVDAGALSGASVLPDGVDAAVAQATAYTALHTAAAEPVVDGLTTAVTVSVGNWEGLRETFLPLDGTETVSPNAVRVRGERNQLQLYFARVLGVQSTRVAKGAVATLGSGRCLGIWGLEGITGNGNVYTDSYDSGDGVYGGANVLPNGDICSNADIELSGSAVDIHGDARKRTGSERI